MKKLLSFLALLPTIVTFQSFAQVNSTNGVFNANSTTANLTLQTNGTARVTVINTGTTAGHVGIGITAPTERLHVSGNILASGNVTGGNLIPSLGIINSTSSTADLTLRTNNTVRMTIVRANGNVGVGVTAPAQKFEVSGNSLATQVWSSSGTFNCTGTSNLNFSTNGTSRVTVLSASGNVGVGVTNPLQRFHVAGGNVILDNGSAPTIFTGTGSTELNRYLQIANANGLASPSGIKAGGLLIADAFTYASPSKNDLVVKGKVGIGTPLTSNPNSYLLAVNGKIGAKDVQIEGASTTWPDYVFGSSYELPLLSEVEEFILHNNHLPEVPSAASVAEHGYSMSDLDKTLLKKVEELTLYIIQQQKEIDALKQKLDGQ